MNHGASLDRLAAADRRLRSACGLLASLSPGREQATPLATIGEHFLTARIAPELGEAFASTLAAVVEAQGEAFPGNLFWDYDYPAARLFSYVRAAPEHALSKLGEIRELIVSLQRTFGRHSKIQFSYAHDFVYGFDWARWVARDAGERHRVGPFDLPFLQYLLQRSQELLALIHENDSVYPSLPAGQARNPFGFLRDPVSERRLHLDLAERRLVPVEAWRYDAEPEWEQPFSRIREERARALGLWVGRT